MRDDACPGRTPVGTDGDSFSVLRSAFYVLRSTCSERRTSNEERRTKNGERRTENGERRTENGERRTENGERRTENGERRTKQDGRAFFLPPSSPRTAANRTGLAGAAGSAKTRGGGRWRFPCASGAMPCALSSAGSVAS